MWQVFLYGNPEKLFSDAVKVKPGSVGDPRMLEMREPGMSARKLHIGSGTSLRERNVLQPTNLTWSDRIWSFPCWVLILFLTSISSL